MENSHSRYSGLQRITDEPLNQLEAAAQAETSRDGANSYPTWRSSFSFTTRSHVIILVISIIISIAAGLVEPVFAILLGKIFDEFTDFGGGMLDGTSFHQDVKTHSIYLVLLGLGSWLLNALFYSSWIAFGEIQANACQRELREALLLKPVGWYDMRTAGIGSLTPRIQSQIRDLQLGTSQPMGYVLQYVVAFCALLGIAFYYCWNLTLVIFAIVPCSAFVLSFLSRRMQPSIEYQQQSLAKASQIAANCFTNIETVKYFNGQRSEAEKYAVAIHHAGRHYLRQARANALQIGLVRLVTLAMFVQGFWYGHYLVSNQKKNTGTVITTFWSCLTATQAFEDMLPHILVLEKGRAAGLALLNITRHDNEGKKVKKSSSNCAPQTCKGQIILEDVSFAYPTEIHRLVLRNTSIKFEAGLFTYIIGESGSGKSTIAQLLLRFYSPSIGRIYFDSMPIEDIDPAWLRENITLIEQTSTIFDGTISENISIAKSRGSAPTEAEIKTAIEFALLQHTVHDLPDGVNTRLTPDGGTLSGGQRQRIALARARLRDSPVLILDESTSALDHVSKSLIMSAIRTWRQHKTTIVISHDTSQIENTDAVYLFAKGSVVKQEFGTSSNHSETSQPGWSDSSGVGPCRNLRSTTAESDHSEHLQNDFDGTKPTTISKNHVVSTVDPFKVEASPKRLGSIPAVFGGRGAIASGVTSTSVFASHLQTSPETYVKSDAIERRRDFLGSWSSKLPESLQQNSRTTPARVSDGAIELLEIVGLTAAQNRPTTSKHQLRAAGPNRGVRESEKPVGYDLRFQDDFTTISALLRTIWPTLDRRTRLLLFVGLFSSFVHAIATPLFSWVFSKLLGTFIQSEGTSGAALKWCLCILCLAISEAIFCFLMHMLLERCGQTWIDKLRVQAMENVLDQPRQFFLETQNNVSELIQNLDRNAEEMRNLLGRFAAFILVAFVMIAVAVVWSLRACWKLTLVGLSVGPASYLVTRSFQEVTASMEAKSNDAANSIAKVLYEICVKFKTIRALNLEQTFRRHHRAATSRSLLTGLKRASCCGLFYGISEAMVYFVNALVFYYGAVLTASKQFSIGSILLVFSMLLFSMANLSAIIAFIPQIQSSKDSGRRLMRLAQLARTSHEHKGHMSLIVAADIVCHNLSFSYPKRHDETVLHNVNITFKRGTVTALVGPSGSGKSTIASLLLRLYPTQKAGRTPQITINRRDITMLHTASLRNLIAIVPQTCVLFPATVAENISYGIYDDCGEAMMERVRQAASDAGIHTFILSLPSGYETRIGDGGIGVSGGQAQRIAIARALIRDPAILILDEATSALDATNAAVVRASIQRLIRKKPLLTTIIITHSKDMMELADRVAMLDRGVLVEEGPLQELIARRGKLASLLRGGEWMI